MGVHPPLVAADLVDVPHQEELFGQRLERFEHVVEAFLLERRGDAESEEDVESAHGDAGGGGPGGSGQHFLEQRQADADSAETSKEGPARERIAGQRCHVGGGGWEDVSGIGRE